MDKPILIPDAGVIVAIDVNGRRLTLDKPIPVTKRGRKWKKIVAEKVKEHIANLSAEPE